MGKAVLFNIPASGHINPSLPVVKALMERGEQVVYINDESVRDQVEATGARFIAYPPMDDLRELMAADHGNIARNMATLVRIAERLMPFVIDTIEREKPDYLIYDTLCSWASMAAQKFQLPTVTLCSTFIIDNDNMPKMSLPAMTTLLFQMARVFPGYMRSANRIRNTYRIKPTSLIGAVMSLADLNIVFTSRMFQPSGEQFSDRYVFVGGATELRPATTDFPFDQLTRKPVVYISLGTINNTRTDFYRTCFRSFADFDAQFVLSAGKSTDISALGAIPSNFIVRNFVPQLDILKHADAFITHGGMNSVHEALMNHVPLVVIPQQAEQSLVASQVVKHGAGVAFGERPPYGKVTVEELRDGLREVLSKPSYVENAARIGESLHQAGGSQRAADAILEFVGQGMPAL